MESFTLVLKFTPILGQIHEDTHTFFHMFYRDQITLQQIVIAGLEKTVGNVWENITLVRRSDCNHLCCKFFIKVSCICFRCNLWLKWRYKLWKTEKYCLFTGSWRTISSRQELKHGYKLQWLQKKKTPTIHKKGTACIKARCALMRLLRYCASRI